MVDSLDLVTSVMVKVAPWSNPYLHIPETGHHDDRIASMDSEHFRVKGQQGALLRGD